MKVLKISLMSLGILLMLFGIFKWYESLTPPLLPVSAKNIFISKIEEEIQELSQMADSKFGNDLYKEINYLIGEYHKEGRLGQNPLENDQEKENLSKRLYSTYADKFINQSFYVFNRPNWEFKDLTFIRNELKELQSSLLLEENSPVNQKFTEMQRIFKQYDDVVKLISVSKNFSFYGTDLTSRFPIEEVIEKLSQVNSYQLNRLGNSYVNNCSRLHSELSEVSEILFRANTRYLDNKIDAWSGMYINYNSQRTYAENLYKQIASEIEEMDNDVYKSSNFDFEYSRLKRKWQEDAQKAYEHFNQ
jgi:hypothetical protein